MPTFIREFPNGHIGMQVTQRSEEIEAIARRFMDAGGRYFVAVHPDGRVELRAMVESTLCPGSFVGVREDDARNDASLPGCIDELVRRSESFIAGRGLQ